MSFEKPWGNYLLKDIVETKTPDSISFWPETIAWQLLFIVLVLFIIKKSYQSWQNYQANAYRREALFWLAQCSLTKEEDIRQLPALLRKTAILANNRRINESNSVQEKALALKIKQEIIELRGEAWTKWLDQYCSESHFHNKNIELNTTTSSCEYLLSQLAYMPKVDLNDALFHKQLKKLYQQIECWIKYHEISIAAKAVAVPSGADGVSV
ncbi:DUF4381 domain-containing protein [Colwellia psychrerythraea]|uniref:DUF4381 domain-containing protein n=1 Tax=Colwellia psychrerythraea TaxID=28229 RepID=A0A099L503_COLPS|nr:DUF4381 domain-containing protein [Colwellia psychrerythraea]KGJ97926.1 hypothetical protein GAB14E_0863 [Colwellia psychrerythraea]